MSTKLYARSCTIAREEFWAQKSLIAETFLLALLTIFTAFCFLRNLVDQISLLLYKLCLGNVKPLLIKNGPYLSGYILSHIGVGIIYRNVLLIKYLGTYLLEI